jgi:hypothetical protein
MSNLAELVVKCARRLGDAVMIEATTTGTLTTFVDTLHVDADRRHWAGSQIFFYEELQNNFGLSRIISGCTTNTLSWAVSITNAPISGNDAVIVNARGKGFEIDEYRNAINDGISRLRGVVMQHVQNEPGLVTLDDTVAVPAALNELYAVSWYDSSCERWNVVPKARGRNGDGWSVEDVSTIRITGDLLRGFTGVDLRFSGYAYQEELDAYGDDLTIAETPVIEYAVMSLNKAGIERDNRNAILFTPNENDAKTAMTRYRTVRQRGTVVVNA